MQLSVITLPFAFPPHNPPSRGVLLLPPKSHPQPSLPHIFPAGNANCAGDKIPKKRAHDYSTAASRLFRDAGAMMHGMVLANVQKPLVSLSGL